MNKDYENRKKRNALDIHSNTSEEEINNFWCLTHNKNYIAHEKMPSRLNTDAACVSNTLHLISLLSLMSSQTHLELTTTQSTTQHQETIIVCSDMKLDILESCTCLGKYK